jgi:predicted SprT family Zn-dependent metalloprotease
MDSNESTTEQVHRELETAFRFFNEHLFSGELPDCFINTQRVRGSHGYFIANRLIRQDAEMRHEIGINPQIFALSTLPEVLSVLAHNMCHAWAHDQGVQGRRGYHSAGWADKMELIGLMPSTTGKPGGKRTGERVEHFIISDGPFDRVCRALIDTGFNITWLDRVAVPFVDENSPERAQLVLAAPLLGRVGVLMPHAEDDENLGALGTETDAEGIENLAQPSIAWHRGGEAESAENLGAGMDDLEMRHYERPSSDDEVPLFSLLDVAASPAPSEQPVLLESGSKARMGEKPKTVPLITLSGPAQVEGAKTRRDKVGFQCPKCKQKAWAKASSLLDCGKCKVPLVSKEPQPRAGSARAPAEETEAA